MITQLETIAIKKYLGKQYSPKIIAHLNKKKKFNEKKESFSKASIYNIVKGIQENEIVEAEIFKLIAKIKAAKEKDKINRKQIIK